MASGKDKIEEFNHNSSIRNFQRQLQLCHFLLKSFLKHQNKYVKSRKERKEDSKKIFDNASGTFRHKEVNGRVTPRPITHQILFALLLIQKMRYIEKDLGH
jgi:hypothetical protein